MSDPKPLQSEASSAVVLYQIAISEKPLTVNEITNRLEANRENVKKAVARLYRSGFLLRRKRETDGFGGVPYEYALRVPE